MEVKLKEVRNIIREYREKNGLSQEDIAVDLDLSQGFYAKLENGTSKLTLEYFLKIKDRLKIPSEKFRKILYSHAIVSLEDLQSLITACIAA